MKKGSGYCFTTMRNVDPHLLEDKMDEAVHHYINTHPGGEGEVGVGALPPDESRITHTYSTLHRAEVVTGGSTTEGTWGEELLDAEGRLAAIVAHLTHSTPSTHKVAQVKNDVDTSVMIDSSLRLFNGQTLCENGEALVVSVPLPPLPPLHNVKRCDPHWFKNENDSEEEPVMVVCGEDAGVAQGGAGCKPSKKSLPHKKRLSKKLRRNPGNSVPQQQELVVVEVPSARAAAHEQILPDLQPLHELQPQHHAPELRAVLVCAECGAYFGDQLRFYHHLKHHYEPHLVEPALPHASHVPHVPHSHHAHVPHGHVPHAHVTHASHVHAQSDAHTTHAHAMHEPADKLVPCSTATTSPLPDSLVELSLYAPPAPPSDRLLYVNNSKQIQYTTERERRSRPKQEDEDTAPAVVEDGVGSEFSEPEDLMEGIHVAVEAAYEHTLLPTLTVDTGHVSQDHHRHWYAPRTGCSCSEPCAHEPRHDVPEILQEPHEPHEQVHEPHEQVHEPHEQVHEPHEQVHEPHEQVHESQEQVHDQRVAQDENFKEKSVLQHLLESVPPAAAGLPAARGKKRKTFSCGDCGREFQHRNSLLYHALSHAERRHECPQCHKAFYTVNALKIHGRTHSGDRPYKCNDCGRDFRQWGDLRYHKLSVHTAEKQHKCEFCGKEFARRYSLSIHRRIHTGERKFACEYCAKTFRASSDRAAHERTHTGAKPYACALCGKAFRVPGDLRRHTRVHERARAAPARRPPAKPDPDPGFIERLTALYNIPA